MLLISRKYGKINTNIYFLLGLIAITLVQNAHSDQAAVKSESNPTSEKSPDATKSSSKTSKSKAIIVVAQKPETSSSIDPDKPNWYDWAGVPENSMNWLPTPKTTPLTLVEQEKRVIAQMHRGKVTQSVSGPPSSQPSHYTKGAKKQKKPIKPLGSSPFNFEQLKMDDIRGRMMNYGKMLFDYMGISSLDDLLPSGSENFDNYDVGSGRGKKNSGGWSSQQYHYSSTGEEKPAGKSLLKWLSRLIGIEGKSLGEFLREYQVHVLYDLVFTFFKWIFFLYAGLLIP